MARPKGSPQKRDEKRYWLPEGVTLKSGQTDNYNKTTKLVFIDSVHGEFTSNFVAIQGANASVHPKALSIRKSLNNPGASKESRAKAQATMLEKYGVANALESPEFIKKSRETFHKNNDMRDVVSKMKNTMMTKYGVSNAMHVQEFKEKVKTTTKERYGVENANLIPYVMEIRAKLSSEKNRSSKEELELKEYIISLGLEAKKGYIGGANPKELDIKVKEKSMAFEMNGLYWHNEVMGKDRQYHVSKTKACNDNGIRLIHIFDKEWHTRREQIKSFIKSALGKNTRYIYARDCEVREVLALTAKNFIERYHILGATTLKGALGLYYKGELVSIVTYNNHHRGNDELLLNRYCTMTDVTVVGGLSKLSKALYKKIGVFSTFIDLRFSEGRSWLNCGYELLKKSEPDYFYYDTNKHKIVPKQSRMKSVVNTPEGMTEKEHATIDGLVRVWDCGKLKLIYNGK